MKDFESTVIEDQKQTIKRLQEENTNLSQAFFLQANYVSVLQKLITDLSNIQDEHTLKSCVQKVQQQLNDYSKLEQLQKTL